MEILVRPNRETKAYRLRCRFSIVAFPKPRFLERAKFEAAEEFVSDMAKQGWTYVSKFGFKMTGPFPKTVTVTLPKRSQQDRWHIPSAEMIRAVRAGYTIDRPPPVDYVSTVPLITETDEWEYELAGVFTRPELLTERPDEHEEGIA